MSNFIPRKTDATKELGVHHAKIWGLGKHSCDWHLNAIPSIKEEKEETPVNYFMYLYYILFYLLF